MKNNKKKNLKQMIALGSKTAKGGFTNEQDVIDRFNNWKTDKVAQEWLAEMNYKIDDIEFVKASKVRGQYKADIQVRITILIKLKSQEDLQNLQVKLVSNPQGFNQIDKRWVDKYVELWNIPSDIVKILKLFTGEIAPTKNDLRDPRRMFLDEMSESDQNKLINFIKENKILIVSDLLKGRGEFSADWTLVILKVNGENAWVLKSINHVMNVFGAGDIRITREGSLKIGKIGMQRKGGDGGRVTCKKDCSYTRGGNFGDRGHTVRCKVETTERLQPFDFFEQLTGHSIAAHHLPHLRHRLKCIIRQLRDVVLIVENVLQNRKKGSVHYPAY